VIGHAFVLTARDLGIGAVVALLLAAAGFAAIVVTREVTRRADARYLAAVERERQAVRNEFRDHERHRTEMRSFSARPTANERWGEVV
jgi:NAD(P)-dependent dehydrogenase (short-subunit alcohol dehydrogenase family)